MPYRQLNNLELEMWMVLIPRLHYCQIAPRLLCVYYSQFGTGIKGSDGPEEHQKSC